MSEEQNVDAESRIERGSERARHALTAAAERARETSKVAQQWWGRAHQRIAKQTSAGVEFARLKREQLERPSHGALDLTLGGDTHLLEEFAHFDVECVLVHAVPRR